MRYGILGATGPLGLALLKQLAGKDVGVYARNPSKLPPGCTAEVTRGDLTDTGKLKNWASGRDIVLCSLGHNSLGKMFFPNLGFGSYAQAKMIRNAISAVLDGAPKRIVHCSAYGTGETREDLAFVFGKVLLPLLLKYSYADHEATEALLAKSKIEWVVARPGMLTNGPAKGKYRTAERFPKGKMFSISRADVAGFMIRASEGREFLRRCVGLGD